MAVKKSFLNAFEKASKTSYFVEHKVAGVGVNPFSSVGMALNPFEMTIYSFCVAWYKRYEYACRYGKKIETVTEVPVSVYDNMRYYFLSLNARAYMELLD